MPKIGRNQICPCRSGKKYKKCCLVALQKQPDISNSTAQVGQLLRDRKLPFRAEITSDGGTSSSMVITDITITDEHGLHQIFNDNVELSAGGDSLSKAVFEVPVQAGKLGRIETVGDAKVVNNTKYYDVILNGNENLKIKSQSGLFASVKTQRQRNIDADVCHIYFGETGRKESIGEGGNKDRPHICLTSTGTGLYTRLASYKCSVTSHSAYERQLKAMSIDRILIMIEDWAEQLEVNFEVDHSAKSVTITKATFVSVR